MKLLAVIALIPVALGPLPQEERSLTIALCLGGEITIPLGDREDRPSRDCHQEGCHAGSCREKTKRAQRTI
ncbi:hypothetical protein CD351_05000 [Erythrobacter sp. KY5]|nr:hypothetical protein CD351_05000 [Erythrobacter sp. KY5]